MRFRYQILLLALLPLVVSVLLSIGEVSQLLNRLKAEIDGDLRTSELKIDREFNAGIKLTLEAANMLAANDEIMLGLQTLDNEMLYRQGRMAMTSDINYVAFLDEQGMVITRSHAENEFGDTIKTEEVDRTLAGEPFFGLARFDNENLLVSMVPIEYYDGTIMGAIVVGIKVQYAYLKDIAALQGVRLQVKKGPHILADSLPGKSTLHMQSMSFPYPRDEETPYSLKVMIDASDRTSILEKLRFRIAIQTIALAIILISLIFFFTNRIVNPIKSLVVAMHDYTSKGVTKFYVPRSAKEILELVKAFRDMIHDLEKNKKSLIRAEKKYRTIFENSIQGIYQIDLSGKILIANPALAKIYGVKSYEDLYGTKIGTHAYKYSSEDYASFIAEVLREGSINLREFVITNSKGDQKHLHESARVIQDESGNPVAIECTIHDVTEKERKETAEREKAVAEAASKAKSVFLDNSGQGFLSFGTPLLVEDEFSHECTNIFPSIKPGSDIRSLLYPEDESGGEQFGKNLIRILNETNEFKRELFISLMPSEFELNLTVVKCDYKVVDDQMMLILTDITAERELEKKAKREQIRHRFIVTTVRTAKDFFDVIESFGQFREKELFPALKSGTISKTEIEELYRGVHTFKGLMLQQDFIYTPDTLHELESCLGSLADEDQDNSDTTDLIQHLYFCDKAFSNDMDIIRDSLGDRFLAEGPTIAVSRNSAEGFRKMASDLLQRAAALGLPKDVRLALEELERIEHLSLTNTLENYGKIVDRQAVSLGKELAPLNVSGKDIFLDAEQYGPFLQSLVHVFRNAVDHGIETPDERMDLDKESTAHINCIIHKSDNEFEIVIEDDGRGIDPDLIRESAVSKGIMSEDEAINMPDEDTYGLIFKSMFSTRDTVSNLSGRGVGLGAVRAEVEELGGKVSVVSELWKGTKFIFKLPLTPETRFEYGSSSSVRQ